MESLRVFKNAMQAHKAKIKEVASKVNKLDLKILTILDRRHAFDYMYMRSREKRVASSISDFDFWTKYQGNDFKNLNGKSNDELIDLKLWNTFFNNSVKGNIKNINNFISTKGPENMFYVDHISGFLLFINSFYRNGNLDVRTISEILGMLIVNMSFIPDEEKEGIEYIKEITFLSKYYNIDGTFILYSSNDDEILDDTNSNFLNYLKAFQENLLAMKFNENDKEHYNHIILNAGTIADNINYSDLLNAIVDLLKSDCLKQNVDKTKETLVSLPEVVEPVIDKKVILPEDALSYISKYFQNGLVLKIPTDMDIFLDNLKATGLPKSEQDFILLTIKQTEARSYLKDYLQEGKVIKLPDNLEEFTYYIMNSSLSLEEKNHILTIVYDGLNDAFLPFLPDKYQEYYLVLLKLLREYSFNDIKYIELKEIQKSIQSIIELANEATEKEDKDILLSELEEVMQSLKNKVDGILQPDNVVYLIGDEGKPFIISDIEALELEERQELTTLLRKWRVQPFSNAYHQIANADNIDLPIFEISGPNCKLYLGEISYDLFVVLGGIGKIGKKRNIINRIYQYRDVIDNFRNQSVKMADRKNILTLGK